MAVNNNCFVNEDCFPLLTPASAPTFDAVLNANAGSWKRHELARDIEALAYITYSKGPDGSLVWPVASFAPLWRNKAYLSESDRRKVYADAVCGLALSACEGANYATVEFLLSGMPIVSTPSIGGRAEWLDAENSIVCAPTPEAVATAVRTWRDRHNAGQIDHMAIRSRCLERMGEHRERFISTLQAMLDQVGEPASASELFADLKATDTMMHSLSFQQGVGPKAHPFCNGKGWYDLTTLPDELAPRP